MALTTLDIATLAAAFGTQAVARTKDDAARSLARALTATTRDNAKREALAVANTHARGIRTYSDDDIARMTLLRKVWWPRARRITGAIATADRAARDANMRHDGPALYDAVYRAHRLLVLSARVNERMADIGRFPICGDDMDATSSRFIGSAYNRRFLFKGGRDVVSQLWSDADVLQGAFLRAIENGDTIFGVPTWGTLFRHIQAERAHLTRVAGAEWRGIQDALHGVRSLVSDYPDADDKHTIRRLGTRDALGRPFGTLDTHRAALAVAHGDVERANIAYAVTTDARNLAILSAPETCFARVLASVLMSGATLDTVADAIGLKPDTIKARALSDNLIVSTGIDHSLDDDPYAVESEYRADMAQEAHARRARERHALTQRALYLANRGAVVRVIVPTTV